METISNNIYRMMENTSWTWWAKFPSLWGNHCQNISGTSSDLFSKIRWEKFFWQKRFPHINYWRLNMGIFCHNLFSQPILLNGANDILGRFVGNDSHKTLEFSQKNSGRILHHPVDVGNHSLMEMSSWLRSKSEMRLVHFGMIFRGLALHCAGNMPSIQQIMLCGIFH